MHSALVDASPNQSTLYTALRNEQYVVYKLQTTHWTLLTSHCTFYTANWTLHTTHCTLDTTHCTLDTTNWTLLLHNLNCILHTEHWPMYTIKCTLHNVYFKLYIAYCTLHCTLHWNAPYNQYYTLNNEYLMLSTKHWRWNTDHCLHTLQWTVNWALNT